MKAVETTVIETLQCSSGSILMQDGNTIASSQNQRDFIKDVSKYFVDKVLPIGGKPNIRVKIEIIID